MTIVAMDIKDEWYTSSAISFVNDFDCVDKFLKDYNLSDTDEWNNEEDDYSIIERYLNDDDGFYMFEYVDDNNFGYFKITELKSLTLR